MVAALVFFFANTLPISVVISLTEGKSARKVWSECYFWSFPYYLVSAATDSGLHRLSTSPEQQDGKPRCSFYLLFIGFIAPTGYILSNTIFIATYWFDVLLPHR